jgi:signal transduction histidine kinase
MSLVTVRNRAARSVYSRSIIMLTFTNVAIFMVIMLVYYGVVSVAIVRQQSSQLTSVASAVAEVMTRSIDPISGQVVGVNTFDYLNFAAESTSSIAWVINKDGEIILKTGIPILLLDKLPISSKGYYRVPPNLLAGADAPKTGVTETNGLDEVFSGQTTDWITAAIPLWTEAGDYFGEVQLHRKMDYSSRDSWYMTNGIVFSFIIALIIALLIIGTLSHTITHPIRLLAEAAEKVARGDLSARVVIPGVNNDSNVSPLLTDDLTSLVSTMNHMIEMLNYQEHDRRDLISSISHDLRTPITSIRGFVEGMLDGTIPQERYKHYLEIVKNESIRLQNLVSSMFEMSLLESGKTYKMSAFDINQVIRGAVVGLEPLLSEKKIGVQIDIPDAGHSKLLAIGDRDAISRVVYNILTNAIQFTPKDGIIAITTHMAKSKLLEVTIEDSGPGVSDNEVGKVFDRFYKSDRSRTGKGSGLGLFICRSILSAHGQKISISKSELGGARFVFTLAAP